MLLGSLQLGAASVDVFPEFAPPRVEIQTACLGLTAQEVEELVSVPIEAAVSGMPGLDEMRSKSVPQLSSIVLLFHQGTDLLNARQLVSERMASVTAALPTWAAPPVMLQPLSATSRVMKIGMTSSEHSLIEMSMLSYWTIRARLLRVPGVANVAIWGERLQMLQVQVEPEKLKAQNVSLNQVMEVTAGALDAGLLQYSPGRFIGTGGFIDSPTQRMGDPPRPADPDARGSGPGDRSGKRTAWRCIWATLPRSWRTTSRSIGDAVINNGHGLMLIVEKLPWGNTLDVTKGVEEALHELQPGLSGITSTPRSSGRRASSRSRSPTSACAAAWLPAGRHDPRRVPLPMAHRPDQPYRHSAVPARGRHWCCTSRRDDQHDGPGGAGHRGRRGGR